MFRQAAVKEHAAAGRAEAAEAEATRLKQELKALHDAQRAEAQKTKRLSESPMAGIFDQYFSKLFKPFSCFRAGR